MPRSWSGLQELELAKSDSDWEVVVVISVEVGLFECWDSG